MEVGIPGTGDQRGIPLAAAFGCLAKAEEPTLTLLEGMNKKWLQQSRDFVTEGRVDIELITDKYGLFVEAHVDDDGGKILLTGTFLSAPSRQTLLWPKALSRKPLRRQYSFWLKPLKSQPSTVPVPK